MFSSPVFYVWLAWLLALAVFAVIRHRARQREELQREARRQQRETERGQRSDIQGASHFASPPAADRLPRSTRTGTCGDAQRKCSCRRWSYQARVRPGRDTRSSDKHVTRTPAVPPIG